MPTVCFCNSNRPWGGGEAWHLNAARSLAARGWRVLLLCHPQGELRRRAKSYPEISPIPIRIGRLSFLNPCLLSRLSRLFKTEAVDAVIMNLPSDLKAAGPAARSAGVRHIIYRRGSALPVRDSALNRCLYGTILTHLIVNSDATKAQVYHNNPRLIPEDRITVIPNGFDIPAFDAALDRASPLPGFQGRYVIGNAGRLDRQKAQHLLLHLIRKLADKGLDAAAIIAGTGERQTELKELAAQLGIEDRVCFPGFMQDLSPFWRTVDLFVLTSLWEGFGNVVIEAMLAEKPVFAFAVSNIPELVRQGPDGNGSLFPLPPEEVANCPDSAPSRPARDDSGTASLHPLDQMAEAVLALARDQKEARRMGRAGRKFALRFSQAACMDMLEGLIGRANGNRRP